MSKTKADQAEATREALVRVGRRLFAQRGFDAVSAEEIVAAARVTRGALYHHYDGKAGLFRAVLGDLMREVHDRLLEASADARSPLEAVERGMHAFLDACSKPSHQRILLVDGPAVLGWTEWRALDLKFGLGLLRRGLEAAERAGEISAPDVETVTHLLAGALIDGAMLLSGNSSSSLRAQVKATLVRLLRGLAKAPTRS
jgi:AcrR family transcriptional regulator